MKGIVKRVWKMIKPFNEEAVPELIGIIGTGRGTGVTHFAVMTAGYLSGVMRIRCAVLEWNSHESIHAMGAVCGGEKKGENSFRVLETDYFAKAGIDTLLLCKKSGYQAVIVDYGTAEEGNLGEFFRCGRQLVIGSLSEWQISEFLEFEKREIKAERSWESLVSFGSEEARKSLEKRLKVPVRRIPFSTDPFSVTAEIISFYEQLF
ncbi:hypothetical protein [Lacrimispora sp. 38-1]|uniref:hypothetical protein n=1 Tax=Lacrimispora sp. 38-1 TaxID=3125778 RepID=UPI003CF42621